MTLLIWRMHVKVIVPIERTLLLKDQKFQAYMDIYMYIQAHDDIPKCLENCQEGGCQITNLYISGTLSLSCPIWQCLGSSGCYLFFMVAMTTIWMPLNLHLWMVLNSG